MLNVKLRWNSLNDCCTNFVFERDMCVIPNWNANYYMLWLAVYCLQENPFRPTRRLTNLDCVYHAEGCMFNALLFWMPHDLNELKRCTALIIKTERNELIRFE
ncbi:hypothetical protein EG68_12636 [Paragonimus skrjabini miyazakii]|uniref:Uncharacterized protein n=1 Tax=Paragonimus skrjabini miyazakii TaxID=59628 RepID=A0A8S9YF81_9TREM|nr:hypothetical protein EG68_12636 [Paragonimus skrjabini miyazakii]